MEANLLFEKRIIEQKTIHTSQPIILNSILPNQGQYPPVHFSQQTTQLQHHCLERPQQLYVQTPAAKLHRQIQPSNIQILKYQPYESPMTLNAWTQTNPDDFPQPSELLQNETALTAKILELEENFQTQSFIIRDLEEKKIGCQVSNQKISHTTPSMHSEFKTYPIRILNQLNGLINETQLEFKINDDIETSTACSLNMGSVSKDVAEHISDGSMVSIGPNQTKIPKGEFDRISWASVSVATRRLLRLIFDRKTLATHSMTGKASPAFKDLKKPVKDKLDPKAIQDIIFIVSRKCKVSEKEVRTSITTKCADENKMLRLKAVKMYGIPATDRRALKVFNK